MPDLLPVLDLAPLRDLLELGAEPELVQELIGLLEEDIPVRLAGLRKALAAADAEAAVQDAHQMKGALGNMGLLRFAELARRMEEASREGRLEEVRDLVEAIPAAHKEALAALRKAFPGA